jgi:hypothetical protein
MRSEIAGTGWWQYLPGPAPIQQRSVVYSITVPSEMPISTAQVWGEAIRCRPQ